MAAYFPTIGNYRLLKELASGAFGRVYQAEHLYLTNRIVAVKLLHAHLTSEKEREGFLHEAQILSLLQHPHILPVIDVGIHDGMPYMITEFAAQGSLRDRLRTLSPQLLPPAEAMRVLTQIAQALQLAHQRQIIHRDLKPDNVLFDARGNALLADFGISTVLSSMSVNVATLTGTPPYMAPEQFQSSISKESDQYALGCLAYELFTGRLPFTATDFFALAMKHMNELPPAPTSINPHIPDYVSQAVLKTLAKDRRQRYPDVMDFIAALSSAPPQPTTSSPYSASSQNNSPIQGTAASQNNSTFQGSSSFPRTSPIQGNATSQNSSPIQGSSSSPRTSPIQGSSSSLEAPPSHNRVPAPGGSFLENFYFAVTEKISQFFTGPTLDPHAANVHQLRGDEYYTQKKYEEALQAYDKAISLYPEYAEAHCTRGEVLRKLRRYDEALLAYEEAIRYKPDYVHAYENRGDTLRKLKRYQEALYSYDEAIRHKPEHINAHIGKGLTLQALKRYDEALLTYKEVVRLKPDNVAVYQARIAELKKLKQEEERPQTARPVTTTNKGNTQTARPVTTTSKGNTQKDVKQKEETLARFKEAATINTRGERLRQLKQYDEALLAYAEAISLNPAYAVAYNNKGLALSKLNRHEEALAAYNQALHLDPQNKPAQQNKTALLKKLNQSG